MNNDLKERIIKLFDEKKFVSNCLCCNCTDLRVLNGFFINIIHDDPQVKDMLGKQREGIPTIVYYCNNCGYIMQFNLAVAYDLD